MRPPREAAAGARAREQVVRALTHAAEGAARRLGMDAHGEYERQASSASRPALETLCGSIDASDPSPPRRRGVRPASTSGHRGNRAQPARTAESPPAQPAAGRCTWDTCGGAELEGKLEHLGDGALSSLGVLDLGGCEIGPSGAADLADAFEHGASAQLVSLYLDANPIRGAGAAAVSSAICAGALPELRLLDLCDCWLDERDTRLFQGAQ